MSALFALAAGLMSLSAETDGKKLILEFPDGVRGGFGKIQGNAPYGADLTIEKMVRRCGARNVVYVNNISHRVYFIADSTIADNEVVACIKRRSSWHFSAGIGSWGSGDVLPSSDESAFRQFWTDLDVPPKKAR